MIFKIIGGLLIIFGLVDLIGSFLEFDLWGTLGVTLPEIIWQFSAYAEIAIGFVIFQLGGKKSDEK